MGNVSESIFSGKSFVIPLAEVLFIERDLREGYEDAISVIFKGTTWNAEIDAWNNIAWIRGEEAKSFKRLWCVYRSELESESLTDINPIDELIPGTMEALNKLGK